VKRLPLVYYSLQKNGIDVKKIRGQAYNGVSAMSSPNVGAQARAKEIQPLALLTHCCSHVLNLSIATSCQIQAIRNMRGTINEVFIFFIHHQKGKDFLNLSFPKKIQAAG
jgi:hypothetical protein